MAALGHLTIGSNGRILVLAVLIGRPEHEVDVGHVCRVGLRSRSGLAPLYHMPPNPDCWSQPECASGWQRVRRVYGEHFAEYLIHFVRIARLVGLCGTQHLIIGHLLPCGIGRLLVTAVTRFEFHNVLVNLHTVLVVARSRIALGQEEGEVGIGGVGLIPFGEYLDSFVPLLVVESIRPPSRYKSGR